MEVVKERRENWQVKVMDKMGSLAEKLLTGELEGTRPRGRPRKRWRDEF